MSYSKESKLTKKDFISSLKNYLDFLEKEGFLMQKTYNTSRSINFQKINESGFFQISIGFSDRLFYEPYTPSISRRFNLLEDLISKFKNSDNLKSSIILKYDAQKFITQLYAEGNDYNGKKDFQIYEEADLALYADFVKKIYYDIAIPFFEKYDSLEKVYEDSKDLKMEDIGKIFYNYGNDHNLRKIALGYLMSKEIGNAEYFKVKEYLEQYLDQAPELFEGLLAEIKAIYDEYQK